MFPILEVPRVRDTGIQEDIPIILFQHHLLRQGSQMSSGERMGGLTGNSGERGRGIET